MMHTQVQSDAESIKLIRPWEGVARPMTTYAVSNQPPVQAAPLLDFTLRVRCRGGDVNAPPT